MAKFCASPGGSNTSIPKLKEFSDAEFSSYKAAIFDEHDGAEEELDIDFTPKILQRIVDASNARYADTGDAVPIIDKHTSDEDGEQPEILGYASHFELGDIGNEKPRKAIFCQMHIFKDKVEKAKGLPRRSIELWEDFAIDPIVLKKSPIDSIALLGAERPARDLGILKMKKRGEPHRYEQEQTEDKMNPEDLIKQCVEALAQMPEMQYIRELMAKSEETSEAAAPDEAPEQFADEEKPEAMAEDKDEDVLEPAKLRMQRDQERRRYAKLDTEYKHLFSKVANLERKERIAERKAELIGLEGEGLVFDIAEELDLCSEMEPARFSKHVEHIRKRYQRAPIGVHIRPVVPHQESNELETPERVASDAIKRARELYK